MSSTQVLQEYLVSVGFKIQDAQLSKLESKLGSTGQRILAFGKTAIAASVAVAAATVKFEYSMREMYFASRLAGSSISGIKAMQVAGEKFGITAGDMASSIQTLGVSLRLTPGLREYAEALTGISLKGKSAIEVQEALMSSAAVNQGGVAGERIGADIMNKITGMSAEDFLKYKDNHASIRSEAAKTKAVLDSQGFGSGKQVDNALKLTSSIDDVKVALEAIGANKLDKVAAGLNSMADGAKHLIDEMDGVVSAVDKLSYALDALVLAQGGKMLLKLLGIGGGSAATAGGGAAAIASSAALPIVGAIAAPVAAAVLLQSHQDEIDKAAGRKTQSQYAAAGPSFFDVLLGRDRGNSRQSSSGKISGLSTGSDSSFAKLESLHGLPKGLLTGMWGAESSYGKKMLSPAGAKGHFGFMDGTAKQYGVSNPNDLNQSAAGASSMMQHLMSKYGNTQLALQAYNWGEGNVDAFLKTGRGVNGQSMPLETQNYPNRVASMAGGTYLGSSSNGAVSVVQNNDIKINASGVTPEAASKAMVSTYESSLQNLSREAVGRS